MSVIIGIVTFFMNDVFVFVVLTRVTFAASPTVMFPSSEAKGGVAWGHCGTEVLVVPFQTRAHDGSVLRSNELMRLV